MSNGVDVSKKILLKWTDLLVESQGNAWSLKPKVVMVVAALAAYKHDTLGRYLPTVLHFRLQATLFLYKFGWVMQLD